MRNQASFYVLLDTFWQNSRNRWFGPYRTRREAELVIGNSEVFDNRSGTMARDVANQTRVLGVFSNTQSRLMGRREDENTLPALDVLPDSTEELAELEDCYGL